VSFRFSCESLFESEFLQHYPTPDLLNTTADKLRWYRLDNGYLQSEIADMIGVYRSTYIHYEEPSRKFYELDKLQLLADLYKVEIEYLLDDYMLFLYRGQDKQLKALRKELGLTQRQFADMVGVRYISLKQWEQERCVMLYDNYMLLKDYITIDKTRTS
jgi:transcriptional regulator with XRE-family HTH domain